VLLAEGILPDDMASAVIPEGGASERKRIDEKNLFGR
jgi:hypothetical protein